MIFTLDTNILIDAVRQPSDLIRLKQFLEWALPQTVLSSVVACELLSGARTEKARTFIETELLAPFARRRRVHAPSAAAWTKTGLLLGRERGRALDVAWQNDLLLAHTARELGWIVLTRDRDFTSIRAYLKGLKVELPFPLRPVAASARRSARLVR